MLLRYIQMAMDDAKPTPPGPRMPSVDKPVTGNNASGPKNETLEEHKLHCDAKPGNCPFERRVAKEAEQKGVENTARATAVKANAARAGKRNQAKVEPKQFKTVEEADAYAKSLIEAEPDPKRKAQMKKAWDISYSKLIVNDVLAKVKAKNAVETALTETGNAQPAPKQPMTLPDADDHDGWKQHYKNLFDGKKQQLDQQYAAGQLDDDAYTDALESAKDKYEARCAKIDKKIKAEADAKAAEEEAQKKAAAAAQPTAPEPQKDVPPPPTMPEDDDEEGHKAWHQGLHDEAMQALNEEWKKGGLSKEAYGKKYQAIRQKLKDGMASVQAKFHPEPKPGEGSEQPAAEQANVNMTGIASDDQQKEVAERVGVLNNAMKDAGIDTQIHAVHATPFGTSFVFKHKGSLSNGQRDMLESNLGTKLDISMVPGKPHTWAVKFANKNVADVSFDKMMNDEGMQKKAEGMLTPLALGMDEKGRYQVIDMYSLPHILVGGSTGGGKSTITNAALSSLLKMRSPDDIEVYCADGKGTELNAYKDMPHVRKAVMGPDVKATADMIDDCIQEMEDRNEFFKNLYDKYHVTIHDLKGYTNFREKHPELKLPKIRPRLLVIEELATFADNPNDCDAIMGRLKKLGEKARSAGINVFATTQDAVKTTVGDLKKVFPARIAVRSGRQMAQNIGIKEARGLTGKGDAYFREGEDTPLIRFKGAFIKDQAQGNETQSEMDKNLESIYAKWGGKKQPEAPKQAASEGSQPASGAETQAGGGQAAAEQPSATTQPYTAGKTSDDYHYPNSQDPVDISHLGFFQAVVEAVKQGANGNSVVYNHEAYQQMGAENWAKHLASQKNGTPDYSQHHLATIHPLPETANEHQREMYKKWCGKINAEWNKGDQSDPARIHAIELQYLKWLKDEGLDAWSVGAKKPHVNKYLNPGT